MTQTIDAPRVAVVVEHGTNYRPLTAEQQRAVLAFAMYAQKHERLEVRWVDSRMVCQLVNTEECQRV